MTGLFKAIKSIFTYREPKDIEGFEFIDDKYEYDSDDNQDNPTSAGDSYNQKTSISRRTPIKASEWNETKKEMHKKQEQSSESTVAANIDTNIEKMKQEFNVSKNQDVIIREFKVARRINAFILYVDGMVDKYILNSLVLRQLMTPEHFIDLKDNYPIDYIIDNILSVNQINRERKYENITEQVLSGSTALFIDGCGECLIIESRGFEKRSIEQPVVEKVIKGSHEAFTENMRTNITLIRRIIRNKKLTTEIIPIDKTNKTNSAILYIDGIANPRIINELKRRIKKLNIDFISGNGMMEELIADKTLMPFPQILTTERPDRAASLIMDGKVIMIMEGTPFASALPTSFIESLQSPEDFFLKWQYSTFLRYIRLLSAFTTLLLPAMYVGVTLYHHEMIPTELLISIVKSRENVPFPTILELFIMEVAFEMIHEGAIRVPVSLGNTLGIVGALILGQAAVQAQLVSSVLIIIVAVTAISSYAIPLYATAFTLRILRFVFIFFAAVAGFYGISVALTLALGAACSVKSFGVPYFSPVAPKTEANPDIITSLPSYKQKKRPDFVNPQDKIKSGKVTEEWLKKWRRNKK